MKTTKTRLMKWWKASGKKNERLLNLAVNGALKKAVYSTKEVKKLRSRSAFNMYMI